MRRSRTLAPLAATLLAVLGAEVACAPPARAEGAAPRPRANPTSRHTAQVPIEVEWATRQGVQWLLQQQLRDGSWPSEPGEQGDVASTVVAVLSLMASGSTSERGPYAGAVRRGVEYVVAQSMEAGASGDILPSHGSLPQRKLGRNVHTYFAAMLLCEVLGTQERIAQEARVRQAARRLVQRIAQTQADDGSWNFDGWAPILATATAFMSLRSAHAVGLTFDGAKLDKVLTYIEGTYRPDGSFDTRHGAGVPLYDNCSALRILYGMGMERDPKAIRATENLFDPVRSRAFGQAGGEEYLAWWFATSATVHAGGEIWARWYPEIARKIVSVQNADGSWSGHHCLTGRVFCTATALLTLQTPNRYLPMDEL